MPLTSSDNLITNPPPEPAPITIRYNEGMDYDRYSQAISEIRKRGQEVRVNGECRADCTMVLELPKVCVGKEAVFRWRHPIDQSNGQSRSDLSDEMLERLPRTLYSRLYGVVRSYYDLDATLDYDDLIALGVRDCSDPIKSQQENKQQNTQATSTGSNSLLHPPPGRDPIVILDNPGGSVEEYTRAIAGLEQSGRAVEVRGSCRSACTMVLALPRVCVDHNAIFKWHHAYEKYTGLKRPDITSWMVAILPPKIQARLEGTITEKYNPKATLDYTELVSLGVRDCDQRTSPPALLTSRVLQNQEFSSNRKNLQPSYNPEKTDQTYRLTTYTPHSSVTGANARSKKYVRKTVGPFELLGRTIVSATKLPFQVLGSLISPEYKRRSSQR